jgi:pimeloyl-ACP methyl ester carboxylesterase
MIRTRAGRGLLALVALGALLATAPLARAQGRPAPATPATGADFAGLVDVGGGRRLYLECRGAGSPTVVLEAGYPNSGAVWDTDALPPGVAGPAVLPAVAGFTSVCAYDRPGTLLDADHRGRSDPAPMPRTARDMVADLHALLRAADVAGPYVLVGHSLGGILVRLYAAEYPAEVAGLVLVDASHEDQNIRFRAVLTPDQRAVFERLTEPDLPGAEQADVDASFAQLRQAAAVHPLRRLPLVVLSHGRPLGADLPPEALALVPPGIFEAIEPEAQALQAALAELVPGARHVIATGSGHYIQLEQPELVIDAIRQVVEAVRDPRGWSGAPIQLPHAALP